jgi:outer membrane immunogenic protein
LKSGSLSSYRGALQSNRARHVGDCDASATVAGKPSGCRIVQLLHAWVQDNAPGARVAIGDLNGRAIGGTHVSRILLGIMAVGLTTAQALAADPGAPIPAGPTIDWSGVYAGVHGGQVWGRHHVEDVDPFNLDPPRYDLSPSGLMGGVQGGLNYLMGRYVLGIEADATFGRISGSVDPAYTSVDEATIDVSLLASARIRAGWLLTDSTMLFATGGLGFAHWTDRNFIGGTQFGGDYDQSKTGWTLGVGVETVLTEHLSIKAEYMHYDFGSWSAPSPGGVFWAINDDMFRTSFDSVRVGLNYRFGGGIH